MVKAMKNKDKYDLRDITYVIDVHGCEYEFVIYHNSIEVYRENFDIFSPACSAFTKWLEQEYKPPILNDVEKAYLSSVIKPFRDKVRFIMKYTFSEKKEFLTIDICKDTDIVLPNFIKGTMYKGMVRGKEYTLEELGL